MPPSCLFLPIRPLRLVVCCFLMAGPTAFGANLLVNGDFELPGAALTSDYTSISASSLPGWTSAVGNGSGAANYYSTIGSTATWIPDPQSGSYCVQLDSSNTAANYTTGGSLSQTVSLVAGVNYVLTFYMSAEVGHAAQQGSTPVTSQINVILNGGGFSNNTTSFQASWNGADKANPEPSWVKETLNFTPTSSGNVTLKFLDVWVSNPTSSNASLDNLDLEVLPEMTPWSITAVFVALAVSASIWKASRRRLISKVAT